MNAMYSKNIKTFFVEFLARAATDEQIIRLRDGLIRYDPMISTGQWAFSRKGRGYGDDKAVAFCPVGFMLADPLEGQTCDSAMLAVDASLRRVGIDGRRSPEMRRLIKWIDEDEWESVRADLIEWCDEILYQRDMKSYRDHKSEPENVG